MAKYGIHHACGHETEIVLFGKISEREKTIERMEGRDCPACEAAAARKAAVDAGLPALTGSDKQIAWASDIRAHVLREFDAAKAKIAEAVARKPNAAKVPAVLAEIDKMRKNTSAKWWIESGRYVTAQEIIHTAVKAVI
jgi:hypothetical protein